MLVVWLLVSAFNKRALIMFYALLVYTCINALTTVNFTGFLITSTLFFVAAVSKINLSLQFRKAFLCFGVVYFIGAADQAIYYHIEIDTFFDRVQPYLITAINAYLLVYLLSDGGRQSAKHNGMWITSFCRRIFRLSLR